MPFHTLPPHLILEQLLTTNIYSHNGWARNLFSAAIEGDVSVLEGCPVSLVTLECQFLRPVVKHTSAKLPVCSLQTVIAIEMYMTENPPTLT